MTTSLLFSIMSDGSLLTKKNRDPGNEFVTKVDHWLLINCPIGRNQSLKRQGLKATGRGKLAFDKKVPPGKDLN